MNYPEIKGQIFVNFHTNCGEPEVIIDGDPEGLRSLAKLRETVAKVDQRKIKDLPARFAREHAHLNPGIHLGKNSAALVLGRAEDKSGKLEPAYKPRKVSSAKITGKRVSVAL